MNDSVREVYLFRLMVFVPTEFSCSFQAFAVTCLDVGSSNFVMRFLDHQVVNTTGETVSLQKYSENSC